MFAAETLAYQGAGTEALRAAAVADRADRRVSAQARALNREGRGWRVFLDFSICRVLTCRPGRKMLAA
jgi:hypothetical protein